MKRLVAVFLCMFMLLCGCVAEGGETSENMSEQSTSQQKPAESITENQSTIDANESQTTEESENDVLSDIEDNTSGEDTDESESGSSYMPGLYIYNTWDEVLDDLPNRVLENKTQACVTSLDGARIAEVLGTSRIQVDDNRVRFFASSYNLCVHPVTEETKDRSPWYYGRRDIEESQVYELKEFNRGKGAYRFTKEGIDLYVASTYNLQHFDVCFKIGDYIFEVTTDFQYFYISDGNGMTLMPQDLYDKLLVGNEQYEAFHELCDFSTESSELVRLLKELVANSDNDDTVTE